MLIDCPTCARSYHVGRDDIGDGRSVICPRCDSRWFVDRDGTCVTGPAANDLRTTSVSIRPAAPALANPANGYSPPAPLWRRVRAPAVGITCILLAMGLLGARERIVKTMPRTAAVYAGIGLPVNVRGLEIADLQPERPSDAPANLALTGSIRNVAHKRVVVPRLTYEVRDATGAPLMSWTETMPSKTLAAGRTLPFVSSPRRLPPEGHSILVRFERAEDVLPSVHVASSAN